MLAVQSQHMALNAADVPGPTYKMWNTMSVAKDYDIDALFAWIAQVARGAEGGKLGALILNSHGTCGTIGMGKGITASNASSFDKLKGLVDHIYIVGCKVAGIKQLRSGEYVEGMTLCFELAKRSGAYVYASEATQKPGKNVTDIPYGHIDDFESPSYLFKPDGCTKETWSGKDVLTRRNRSSPSTCPAN